jgi:catechol 2,3-dioxygenase-like lactoylglutathione lyase family enzyme
MEVLGVDNVFIPVGDLDRAVEFYRDVDLLPGLWCGPQTMDGRLVRTGALLRSSDRYCFPRGYHARNVGRGRSAG